MNQEQQIPINETFATIQGEATFAGTPSLFIRTQGCPVWCSWCDTKFTWHLSKKSKLTDQKKVIDKVESNENFCNKTVDQLLDIARFKRDSKHINHIVITGGEPCIHDLERLTKILISNGFTVQIETSCTQHIKCDDRTWVTGSPKINMAGKLPVLYLALERANEIKFPVANQNDIDNLLNLINDNKLQNKTIWIQPVELKGEKKETTELCIKACFEYGFKLSVQTHKYINLK